ncbi:MAG: DNA-directed RNA polymerase subunit alpha [Nitrospinae bacterium]|nr:DNA-directed RNA polymerase subunit alpha [Nitrospinota bacterium]MBF0634313.1 DNA-directed RNA polymerase subunit alpha [Nitrospinota bacterium]
MKTAWQGLVKPKKLEIDPKTKSENFSTFVAEPFERGFGVTIGNSLRRLLLSSIQGAAVVAVKFEGIHHEFSTIDGIVEDVADIILNIKQIVLKKDGGGEETVMTLRASGKGEVKAGSIEVPEGVKILNPGLHIATITEDKAKLNVEMIVRVGRGYQPAERSQNPNWDISVIPIDSVFSPIIKVTYRVEKTRVEQSHDYDKLLLEVTTNGAIRPEDALAQAAKSLKDHLQIFINFEEQDELPAKAINQDRLRVAINLRKSVEELELSVRSYNCLKNANLKTIMELVTKTDQEMLKTRNFGRKSLNEIKEILEDMGLSLGMNVDEYKDELIALEQGTVSV